MTDEFIEAARDAVLGSKLWGRVPHKAIKMGAWDNGQLVQTALQDLLKHRPEAEEE